MMSTKKMFSRHGNSSPAALRFWRLPWTQNQTQPGPGAGCRGRRPEDRKTYSLIIEISFSINRSEFYFWTLDIIQTLKCIDRESLNHCCNIKQPLPVHTGSGTVSDLSPDNKWFCFFSHFQRTKMKNKCQTHSFFLCLNKYQCLII